MHLVEAQPGELPEADAGAEEGGDGDVADGSVLVGFGLADRMFEQRQRFGFAVAGVGVGGGWRKPPGVDEPAAVAVEKIVEAALFEASSAGWGRRPPSGDVPPGEAVSCGAGSRGG